MKNKTGLATTKAVLILALLSIMLLSIFITCEDRVWKNPCDSKTTLNPSEWAPTNLQTEQLSVSQIKLTWQQAEHEIDGFKIDRRIGKSNWINSIATLDEKTKQYIDTNAVPLDINTYRVYAYTGKNNSASILKSLTPSFPPPSKFQIQQLSISELKLTWQDNSNGEDGFKIDRKIGGSNTWQLAIVTLHENSTTWTDTSASPDDVNYYRIYGYKGDKESEKVEKSINAAFPAPSNLEIQQISISELKLTWQDNSYGEDGFKIDRKIGGSNTWQLAIVTLHENSTTWTDNSPEYGEMYYRVYIYKAEKQSSSVEINLNNIIQAPSSLSAEAIDDQSIQLTWTDNCEFETGYKVERKEEGGSFTEVAQPGENITTYTDEGLTYGISYIYRVRANTNANDSEYSNELTTETVFPAPSELNAEALDGQSVRLTWKDNCSFETGYRMERNDGSGFSQVAELAADITTYTDEGLKYGQSYTYRVKAYTSQNESNYSNELQTETLFPAPTDLTAEALDDQGIKLTWVDNCEFESGFHLERDEGSGFSQVTELNANVTTYTDEGLTYGQSYTYRIKAYTSQYESNYSNVTNSIEMIIQSPTNLTAEALDDQSLRLTWTDNCEFESGYRLVRQDDSGITQIAVLDADVTTYTDEGLTYGQIYAYCVKAYTSQNESNYSNEIEAQTVFPAPSNLTAEAIDDQSVQLTWEDNCSFESGYKVERKEEGGTFTEIADLSANAEDYTDEGLTFGVIYTYRIQAYTNSNLSEYSEEVITNMNVVVDIDGNVYKVVNIGDQWWMAENLKVTHYRNGDATPNVTDATEWSNLTTGAYCNYDNDDSNTDTYGSLYNWYAVIDSRNIAPQGWHVPTDEEWKQLEMYLEMSESVANFAGYRGTDEGSKLKSTSGWYNNGNRTDDYGFSALPGGYRRGSGYYSTMGHFAYFWSSTEGYSDYAWNRGLGYNNLDVYRGNYYKQGGLSVRCVRD